MGSKPLLNFTLAEVQQHSTKDDVYIVIHGKVYNVTSYMPDHPGGGDIILTVAGPNGDNASDLFEDVGHSPEAREILATLEIGTLAPPKAAVKIGVVSQLFTTFRARILPFALLGLLLGGSFTYFASDSSIGQGKNSTQI